MYMSSIFMSVKFLHDCSRHVLDHDFFYNVKECLFTPKFSQECNVHISNREATASMIVDKTKHAHRKSDLVGEGGTISATLSESCILQQRNHSMLQ